MEVHILVAMKDSVTIYKHVPNKTSENNSIHPEYCLPLMCGYYASMEQFKFIDIDSFENKIAEFVPASYEPYYREYIQIVRRKRAGEKFSEKESPFYALMLQLAKERKLNILNSHEVNLGNGYFWLW